MPQKCAVSRIRMFTPGIPRRDRLPLTFEIPLSSAARDPTLPRVARLEHQAIGLVFVFSADN
jgi:hypothetical protein